MNWFNLSPFNLAHFNSSLDIHCHEGFFTIQMRLLFQVLAILLIFVLIVIALYVADVKKEEKEKHEDKAKERIDYDFQRETAWENAQKEIQMREEIKKATAQAYKPQETPIVPNQDLFNRKDPEDKLPNENQLPFKMPYFQNLGGIEKFAAQSRKENAPHFGEFAGFKRGAMSLGENNFGTSDNQDVSVYSRGGRAGPAPIQPRRNLADMFGYETNMAPSIETPPSPVAEQTKAPSNPIPKPVKAPKKSRAQPKPQSKPVQHMDALSQLRSEGFSSMGRR